MSIVSFDLIQQRVQIVKLETNLSFLEHTLATPMGRPMNKISVILTGQFSQSIDNPIPALRKPIKARKG